MIRHRYTRWLPLLGSCLILAAGRIAAASTPSASSPGERALMNGEIARSIHELQNSLAIRDDPATHLLLCRAFYAENHFDEAADQCAISTAAPNATSDAFLWQARSLGSKAETSNPFSAFALARQVRASFVQAVQRDPDNLDAVEDLSEFYIQAPSIVGGGIDHARELATAVAPHSRRMQHTLLGKIAAREGDNALAEQEFRAAIDASEPTQLASAWMNLAIFLRRSGQADAAVQAVHQAVQLDPTHSGSLVDAARTLTRLHREPEFAARCLREYIAAPTHTDASPVFKARLQLARLLQSLGDTTAAAHERDIARAMAPDYLPPKHDASDTEQVR